MPASPSIRWPAEFEPTRCSVYVSNEIELAVPENWSCRVYTPKGFHWRTFGTPITSQVLEFEPHERLAWDAKGLGVFAYHAWLITPTPNGCHVLTEECQHGFLATLHSLFMPHDMHDKHQIWLEGLKDS